MTKAIIVIISITVLAFSFALHKDKVKRESEAQDKAEIAALVREMALDRCLERAWSDTDKNICLKRY